MTTHTELAAKAGVHEEKSDGELWSFLRSVMTQGAAIYQDYQGGKYATYEHYSGRLDAAASDRVDLLRAALSTERLAGGGEPAAWGMRWQGHGPIMDCITPEEHDSHEGEYTVALYTTPPPQAERLPLSDEEIGAMLINGNTFEGSLFDFARAIESAHGIGTPKEST